MTLSSFGSRSRLMIADDDPVVRSMLSMTLAERFEVVGVAEDGEGAVELARESRPDAALVDVEMPSGGGVRAVKGITDVSPGTAIVVLSGDESDAVVRDLMAAGATAYRRKGADPHALAECLQEAIRAHADERRSTV